jgi:RimJ/RimL family protein N-acetyltransferase
MQSIKMKRLTLYISLIIFAFMDKTPPSLSEKALANHIFWNSTLRTPIAIAGSTFYLEPCSEDNPEHQRLFQNIFTDPETVKFWALGDVKTKEESLSALTRYSKPWTQQSLLGGFVVIQHNRAVMLVGIGLFQAQGVGEFYIMADPSVRGKGLATEVMGALIRWCTFLKESDIPAFINCVTGKKAPLHTIFATASEENIASIRLMLKSGFHPIQSLHRYRMGMPSGAQMFTAPSAIKGLKNGNLSIIYPNRYMKRKAGFELNMRELDY